jgi:hypothetical protein
MKKLKPYGAGRFASTARPKPGRSVSNGGDVVLWRLVASAGAVGDFHRIGAGE